MNSLFPVARASAMSGFGPASRGLRDGLMAFGRAFVAAVALLGFSAANAATISYGALSSNDDGRTDFILDTLNNYEWLRWDVLADMTYQQTLDAIAPGQAYAGFKIAGIQEAQQFANALLQGGSNLCTTNAFSALICANGLSTDLDALLGSNYTSSASYAWFLSENGNSREVGYLYAAGSAFGKSNDWNSIARSNSFSASGGSASRPISWLVYREVSVVPIPVPASFPLLVVGLAGLGLMSRRRPKAFV